MATDAGFDGVKLHAAHGCLNDEGVDLPEISGGTVDLWSELYANDRGGRGAYFADYARAVRSLARSLAPQAAYDLLPLSARLLVSVGWLTLTIHDTPNLSTHMPNSSPQTCVCMGIVMVPPAEAFPSSRVGCQRRRR
jgi:hypothetical protein